MKWGFLWEDMRFQKQSRNILCYSSLTWSNFFVIKFVYNTKMGPGLPWCRQKSPPKIVDFICVLVKLSQIWYILRTCGFPATNELLLSYWKVQCLIYIMSRKLEGSKSKQEQWRDWVHDEQKPTTYGKIDPIWRMYLVTTFLCFIQE